MKHIKLFENFNISNNENSILFVVDKDNNIIDKYGFFFISDRKEWLNHIPEDLSKQLQYHLLASDDHKEDTSVFLNNVPVNNMDSGKYDSESISKELYDYIVSMKGSYKKT